MVFVSSETYRNGLPYKKGLLLLLAILQGIMLDSYICMAGM